MGNTPSFIYHSSSGRCFMLIFLLFMALILHTHTHTHTAMASSKSNKRSVKLQFHSGLNTWRDDRTIAGEDDPTFEASSSVSASSWTGALTHTHRSRQANQASAEFSPPWHVDRRLSTENNTQIREAQIPSDEQRTNAYGV